MLAFLYQPHDNGLSLQLKTKSTKMKYKRFTLNKFRVLYALVAFKSLLSKSLKYKLIIFFLRYTLNMRIGRSMFVFMPKRRINIK